MRAFAIVCLLIAAAAGTASTLEEFKTWRIAALQEFLSARGLTCKGCAEKADWVKLAFENRETPVKEKEAPSDSGDAKGSSDSGSKEGGKKEFDKEKLEKLMRDSGMGGKFKMYNRDDMDKMLKDRKATGGHKEEDADADEL